MNSAGFVFPVTMGNQVFNLPHNPYRLSIVAFSGLNYIGNAVEHGIEIKTEIGPEISGSRKLWKPVDQIQEISSWFPVFLSCFTVPADPFPVSLPAGTSSGAGFTWDFFVRLV